jgi:type I restriction enzyme S subunit
LPEIKPEEIPFEIPHNWVWCRLEDIGNNEQNSIVDGPFGSSINVSTDYISDGIPVIRMVNVKPFQFINSSLKFIKEEKFETLKRHNIISGDVLVGKVGSIGESCIYPDIMKEGMLATTGLCRYRVGQFVVNKYLCFYLNSITNYLKSIAKQAVQPYLTLGTMKKICFPLPPMPEQHRIVTTIEKLMKLCDELEQSILYNQNQIKELLQVALKEALEPGKIKMGSILL